MSDLSPAEKIIEALGGLTETAKLLDTAEKKFAISTVQGWKERKRIPQEHWTRLMDGGRSKGVEIELAMFLPVSEQAQ